jgi:uncharacterized protein (TIGR02145 family)
MKKLFTLFMIIAVTSTVFAQSPQKMSYQAVIRNSSDQLVANQAVGMQISILQESATGTPVYVETQTSTTNANGLVTIEIGGGTAVTGTFAEIDWSSGAYYLKTETDPTGGTSYTITGVSQILSVPYALYAKTADSLSGGISESDPVFGASVASGIKQSDTTDWNNKLDEESQNLADVLIQGADGNGLRIRNIADPVDVQDAATKAYVDALKSRIEELESQQGIVKDYEGNLYTTIKIGSQVWMAENLRTSVYNDGTPIDKVSGGTGWTALTTGAYCWYNNDSATYEIPYGKLYNWHTVNTGKLCPVGWHVPTDAEWTILTTGLGGTGVAGGKLKETGITHWLSPNSGATNESGFTALPGGGLTGTFHYIGSFGYCWSATEVSTDEAWQRTMYYNHYYVTRTNYLKTYGLSVRCIMSL